jgi:hypothetical protein
MWEFIAGINKGILHSYLVYMYQQQIFIDEIQVYSRRHIQLSSTHAHSGGQLGIYFFSLFSEQCDIDETMLSFKKTTYYLIQLCPCYGFPASKQYRFFFFTTPIINSISVVVI